MSQSDFNKPDENGTGNDGEFLILNANSENRIQLRDVRIYEPRYDGNSSDDENSACSEEKEEIINLGPEDDEMINAYTPLSEDNFGEFFSSVSMQEENDPPVSTDENELVLTKRLKSNHPVASNILNNRGILGSEFSSSVPPLTAERINKIKNIMMNIKITPPGVGAVHIADAIEVKKLRVGDEI